MSVDCFHCYIWHTLPVCILQNLKMGASERVLCTYIHRAEALHQSFHHLKFIDSFQISLHQTAIQYPQYLYYFVRRDLNSLMMQWKITFRPYMIIGKITKQLCDCSLLYACRSKLQSTQINNLLSKSVTSRVRVTAHVIQTTFLEHTLVNPYDTAITVVIEWHHCNLKYVYMKCELYL